MKIFPRNKTDLIISYILEHPNSIARVVEIARVLHLNKGNASLTLGMLEREGLVKNRQVDLKNPITRALKILITTQKFSEVKVLKILKEVALSAGIYGSSARGTDTEDSDIDIWIKPRLKISSMKSLKLSKELEDVIGKRIQIVILDEDKVNSIKRASSNFYYSLVFGSIIIFGDDIESAR